VVNVSVVPAKRTLVPGDAVPVAIILDIRPTWHLWTSESQAADLPDGFATFDGAIYTTIAVEVSHEGIDAATGFVQWPDYHGITAEVGDGPQHYAVYEGRAVAYLPLVVAADATPGPRSLEIAVDLQACNDRRCLMPSTVTATLDLEIVSL